jgi:protein-S-isoprenylcysteine O-methyltransferase Ste14
MPQETGKMILALLAFGLLHSLLAAIGIKALFVTLMGQRGYLGLYRVFYNMVSGITLITILAWGAAQPGEVIWQLDGLARLVFFAIQGIGMIGLLVSLLQIDTLRFLGIRQALAYFTGEPLPLPPEQMSLGGVYALVRHPLYFFSLLVLWCLPTMHAATLGFNIGSTLYFVFGSLLEERKLVKQFGEPYVVYQQRVSWMIPFAKFPVPRSTSPTPPDSTE